MASSISGQRCPALGGLVFIQGEAVEVPNEHYPVLLEFWATWCKICPKAWPHMTEVHHKYRDRGLRVVGVCVEPDSPTVRRYCEDHARDMPYAQAIDSRGDAYALMQRAQRNDVPHAFLIDTAGMIRYHSNPMRLQFAVEVDEMMRELGSSGGMAAAPAARGVPAGGTAEMERVPSCSLGGVCQ